MLNPFKWNLEFKKGSKLGQHSELAAIRKPDEEKVREIKEKTPDIGVILKKLKKMRY